MNCFFSAQEKIWIWGDCEGLEDLCQRIETAARDESECCGPEDDDTDYDDASYMIAIPDEIYEAVEGEDDET